MAIFKLAYNITCAHEGGYVKDPKDNGGETYKGISRNNFPNWQGWKIIDSFKKDAGFPAVLEKHELLNSLVLDFYKSEFWDVNRLTEVAHQEIANELFDTGVNVGIDFAARSLQRALNVANQEGRYYPDMVVDGKIGGTTLKALNAHPKPATILKALNALQGAKYIAICEARQSQERFLNGWMERVSF